jgi:lipopolysaccharide/colanic/teichoic acid biosynthesis glycosyltransferase
VLAGPAVLGTYAVASKYAELVRLPPLALTWVLYPRYARQGAELAARRARAAIVPAGLLTLAIAIPLGLCAFIIFPLIYGSAFRVSILPAQILLVGLLGEGVAGVIIAFLYGVGRPGLTSIATGAGLVVTLGLDLLLIPRYGIPPRPMLRVLDIAVAAVALVMLSPLMLAIALVVRVSSPGPVIYRQWRVGQGGKRFTLYKFRSMQVEHSGPEVTARNDARITPLGRLLRGTALDELPQFFNVLKGEMTLVGPRPETPGLAGRYPEEYAAVFQYRPGLTGPVQLRLRDVDIPDGELADVEGYYLHYLLARRVALDLEYVEAPSVRRAVGLLGQTALYLIHQSRTPVAREPVARTVQQ